MKKLNKKKIKWIVKEVERRELGIWTIAQTQNITKQYAYRVAKKFKNCEPEFKRPGRKPKVITDEEKNVLQTYEEIRSSAVMIEQYLDEKGIHIGHNRIHRILLEAKLAKEEHGKRTEENGLDMKESTATDYRILTGLSTKENNASSSLMMHQDS